MAAEYPLKNPYKLSVRDVEKRLQSDVSNGLTSGEVEARQAQFGLNAYQAKKEKSILLMFLVQFKSPIVYLLFFAAGVSLYLQEIPEAIAIALVIMLNALIGFFMELQARNTMKALREMDVINTRVIRDGRQIEIPSEKITPGDLVIFEAGDLIPGDARLIEANQLQCDESALTGESLPSEKKTAAISADASVGDRHNMVFKGTSVVNGNGKAIVTGIAKDTELGTITSLVENSEESATPLDKKLDDLGKKLIWVTLALTIVFAVTGLIQGKTWAVIIQTSIALAVAAIPEGLPIVATVALAHGMLLMARRNAIVKRLSSVETLGSTNVILTDKTGTLTENRIFADTLIFPEEKLSVKTEGDSPGLASIQKLRDREDYKILIRVSALCNNALVEKRGAETTEKGDPVEIALFHLVEISGFSKKEITGAYPRLAEIPFNSDIKMMGTFHQAEKGYFVAAKGSAEHLLEKCTSIQNGNNVQELTDNKRKELTTWSEELAAEGLRVLAFAYKETAEKSDKGFLEDLVFSGMIGFLDPPRLDIRDAMIRCREAGIRVIMITGDHPKTALNIAIKTGLADDNTSQVITGMDMPPPENLSAEWKNRILSTTVFARATPKQKLDIADIYQKEGNIVAMTGDGVNDAPALKKADVGIAMGLRGTQVAKETAGIILKDDSFTSIAEAVAYGRAIFRNIRKFVIYLLSCNLSEICVVTLLGFIAPQSTLLPLQILFLNMVTDVLPALALGVSKGDDTLMKVPPRRSAEGIISAKEWTSVVFYSVMMSVAVVAALLYCRYYVSVDAVLLNNTAFATLAAAQLFHVFNMAATNSLKNEVTANKYVWFALVICGFFLYLVFVIPATRKVLNLGPVDLNIVTVVVVAALIPLLTGWIYKRSGAGNLK